VRWRRWAGIIPMLHRSPAVQMLDHRSRNLGQCDEFQKLIAGAFQHTFVKSGAMRCLNSEEEGSVAIDRLPNRQLEIATTLSMNCRREGLAHGEAPHVKWTIASRFDHSFCLPIQSRSLACGCLPLLPLQRWPENNNDAGKWGARFAAPEFEASGEKADFIRA